jgi:predicted secreted protein
LKTGFLLKTQDERAGKLVVVAHCVLNQNARVAGLADYSAVIGEVVDTLRKHNVSFLQLPCPELTFAGAQRPRKTKEEYNTPSYRKRCEQIATSITQQIEELRKTGVKVLAVLGVKNSPSCGIDNAVNETGILMEELTHALEERYLKIPMHAIDTSKINESIEWLEDVLR